jgi:Fic family protein
MSPRGRLSRAVVYQRLDEALAEFANRYGSLPPPHDARQIWDEIWHLDAHHSTALEGNTLVLREVEQLLDGDRAVGAKPLAEYNEVRGYADAAQWVYAQAVEPEGWHDGRPLTISEVRRAHELAMTPLWDVSPHPDASGREGPGQFREHDIRTLSGGMKPPPWPLVPARMTDWVEQVCRLPGSVTDTGGGALMEAVGAIHGEFERTHPFIDGNGRTGRLLLNLVLVRLGLPPVVIMKRQRDTYLAALRRADRGDAGPLGELLARSMYDSLNRFLIPALAGPEDLVPLTSLADDELSLAALRQAAQRGRLVAVRRSDGVWRSTRDQVERYRRSRSQGRRSGGAAGRV